MLLLSISPETVLRAHVLRRGEGVVLDRLIPIPSDCRLATASNFRLSLPTDKGDAARAGAVAACIAAADAADREMDKSNKFVSPQGGGWSAACRTSLLGTAQP